MSNDRSCPRYLKCVADTRCPLRSASVCTVLRLFFQYLGTATRQLAFPWQLRRCPDFRYERIGMHAVSHHVGDR